MMTSVSTENLEILILKLSVCVRGEGVMGGNGGLE